MSSRPMPDAPDPSLTPCVNVCRLDAVGLCEGCRRSVEEIMRWQDMSEAERLHLMREVLPQRRPS
jgi:predicted Fe-S protein YdhL (DUF1289 family)